MRKVGFPASNDDQWTVIKRDIDECDYYLLIVAGRYGSTDKDGSGYTEKEYDYAVSVKKPVIAFLHGNSGSLAYDISEKDPKLRRKLKLFCDKAKRKTVRFWSSRDELVAEISTSLPKLIRSHAAEGWVRGRFAANLEETVRLRSRVEELEGKLSKALSNQARPVTSLTSEALALLKEASDCKAGEIRVRRTHYGLSIIAGGFKFEEKDPRDRSEAVFYEGIIGTLHQASLIDKIEDGLYRMNNSGYEHIKELQGTLAGNRSIVTFNISNWHLRYMANVDGEYAEVQPDAASSIEYYFELNAFSDSDKGLGLLDICVEFHEDDAPRLSNEPSRYTGEVRAGADYDPPMPVMTLPAREWVSVALRGVIHGGDISDASRTDHSPRR